MSSAIDDLGPGEKRLLAIIWHANAVGLPADPDCDPFKTVDLHLVHLDGLRVKGLIYLVRETEDSQSGYCLTTEGDAVAGAIVEEPGFRRLSDIVPRAFKPAPAVEGKYGEVTTTGKQFHPGEPVFILRATDPFAPAAIFDYGQRCERAGCGAEHVAAAHAHAKRIKEWQKAHPELVKKLPD